MRKSTLAQDAAAAVGLGGAIFEIDASQSDFIHKAQQKLAQATLRYKEHLTKNQIQALESFANMEA